MYDFKIEAADTATLYRDVAAALEALIGDEPDAIANMANAAALICESLPDLNWVGFYRNIGNEELLLGPFQGRPRGRARLWIESFEWSIRSGIRR